MPSLRFRLPKPVIVAPDWAQIRNELRINEDMSPDVVAAAQAATRKQLPDVDNKTDLPFFTLDPAGSKDLDQAMYLEREPAGYVVHYAIADVSNFVQPNDPMDVRAQQLGETYYGPDKKIPLYPFEMSEGAASLLPDQVRPSVLWTISLDEDGEITSIDVRRALVRSRQQLSYDNEIDNEQIHVLQLIGELREKLARKRDAVDLPSPEQIVEENSHGPSLRYRATTSLEMWNSQISLLTGIAAATLMINAKVGILRTLPEADPHAVESLRLSAKALNIDWPREASYGDVVSATDASTPNGLAFLNLAARLMRGAAYVSFDGTLPEKMMHSGVGSTYAHCTAPLRRLADRYVSEICIATCAGAPIPEWVRNNLDKLPKIMNSADQKAHALDRAIIEATEAYVMASRVGKSFDAVVVEKYEGEKKGTALVQLADPAVRASCDLASRDVEPGTSIKVKCVEADPHTRTVRFVMT